MKSAYLINVGRGPIVNEQALVQALENKEIEGAALDVYEFEPEITDELKSFKNIVLTPILVQHSKLEISWLKFSK